MKIPFVSKISVENCWKSTDFLPKKTSMMVVFFLKQEIYG
jgi:hypothetical protein